MMRQGGELVGDSTSRCQDCGNQAKRDCLYMRCRTCCKSKGFQCQTHIRSTWIPEYRRRQGQQQVASTILPQHLQGHNPQRNRLHNNPTSEEVNFPDEMNSMAIFRCVRVRSKDDMVDEYAYQTTVNIGGRLFRGILYDQGPERAYTTGESSVSALHQYNLTNVAAITSGTATTACTSATAAESFLPPPYPFSFNAFMPGMQHFYHPKP
ncbi:protein SHI RELATED SEQUENCE 1 [Quillaja saponaria]|uniref:Protein SHI RELATED SEQUENCE 1 n=1 Tax=Quillaja saponaria TaxID=32244 RepID=A0AAD7LZR6_QUISA|nr:protein SHI RELATED SEQUENCE 1 [Quillaja saponaria]